MKWFIHQAAIFVFQRKRSCLRNHTSLHMGSHANLCLYEKLQIWYLLIREWIWFHFYPRCTEGRGCGCGCGGTVVTPVPLYKVVCPCDNLNNIIKNFLMFLTWLENSFGTNLDNFDHRYDRSWNMRLMAQKFILTFCHNWSHSLPWNLI